MSLKIPSRSKTNFSLLLSFFLRDMIEQLIFCPPVSLRSYPNPLLLFMSHRFLIGNSIIV